MRIAVVIPALDESSQIEAAILSALATGTPGTTGASSARGGPAAGGGAGGPSDSGTLPGAARGQGPGALVAPEIVVVDGGSRDDTRERARTLGASVVLSGRGRAGQLQAGLDALVGAVHRADAAAETETGIGFASQRAGRLAARPGAAGDPGEDPGEGKADVVVMLHADTRLPDGWADEVQSLMTQRGTVAGAFRFAFAPEELRAARPAERLALRVVEWGARFRTRWLGLPYGDQALFVRREALEAIGGVPQVPLMEDVDLVRRLRGQGRLAVSPLCATTSARRHLERGVWRTAFVHIAAALADRVGVSRDRIAGWLRR